MIGAEAPPLVGEPSTVTSCGSKGLRELLQHRSQDSLQPVKLALRLLVLLLERLDLGLQFIDPGRALRASRDATERQQQDRDRH